MKNYLKIKLALIISLISSNITVLAVNINDLLPRPGATDPDTAKKFTETVQVANLPEVTETALITSIIKTILEAGILLTVIAVVVAGLYYLLAKGEEEQITKAKDILVYLVIGMVVMASAYGIISGLAQIELLK